ncbi:hypothetical protein [Dysgonomonas sp. 520]|uniref:hypothetical protein n=1 Tax=Dysgonomonas sp. 520 TaxID=2302931 RepID=UPI0013D434F3|nr:hypothetical protein [Dysgonomonas sp. 520]NDW10678.1 hypothetical protein [Dysgonomonas sp. 520]
MKHYNYAGNGRGGKYGNNKGKTYINYNIPPIITPEITQRLKEFNKWFEDNYEDIKTILISKNKFNDEVISDTYYKVYRYIEYGGVITSNLRYYWNTSYFTNLFNFTITQSKNEAKFISTSTIDIIDDAEEDEVTYQNNINLINNIQQWLEDNITNDIDRELFIIYMNLKKHPNFKMTYKKLSEITNIPQSRIAETIKKIKEQINKEFKKTRRL